MSNDTPLVLPPGLDCHTLARLLINVIERRSLQVCESDRRCLQRASLILSGNQCKSCDGHSRRNFSNISIKQEPMDDLNSPLPCSSSNFNGNVQRESRGEIGVADMSEISLEIPEIERKIVSENCLSNSTQLVVESQGKEPGENEGNFNETKVQTTKSESFVPNVQPNVENSTSSSNLQLQIEGSTTTFVPSQQHNQQRQQPIETSPSNQPIKVETSTSFTHSCQNLPNLHFPQNETRVSSQFPIQHPQVETSRKDDFVVHSEDTRSTDSETSQRIAYFYGKKLINGKGKPTIIPLDDAYPRISDPRLKKMEAASSIYRVKIKSEPMEDYFDSTSRSTRQINDTNNQCMDMDISSTPEFPLSPDF